MLPLGTKPDCEDDSISLFLYPLYRFSEELKDDICILPGVVPPNLFGRMSPRTAERVKSTNVRLAREL